MNYEPTTGAFIQFSSDATWSPTTYSLGTFVTPAHLCPDILRYEQIGAADGWRGRVVRAFFFVLRLWPVQRGGRE